MNRSFEIRPARIDDAEALANLNMAFNGVSVSVERIAEIIREGSEIVVVAEFARRISGFGCAQVFTSICSPNPAAELTELYLEHSCRGSGAAAALVDKIAVLAAKRGATALRLETGIDNLPARRFYEKCGFTLDDEVAYFKKIGNQSID